MSLYKKICLKLVKWQDNVNNSDLKRQDNIVNNINAIAFLVLALVNFLNCSLDLTMSLVSSVMVFFLFWLSTEVIDILLGASVIKTENGLDSANLIAFSMINLLYITFAFISGILPLNLKITGLRDGVFTILMFIYLNILVCYVLSLVILKIIDLLKKLMPRIKHKVKQVAKEAEAEDSGHTSIAFGITDKVKSSLLSSHRSPLNKQLYDQVLSPVNYAFRSDKPYDDIRSEMVHLFMHRFNAEATRYVKGDDKASDMFIKCCYSINAPDQHRIFNDDKYLDHVIDRPDIHAWFSLWASLMLLEQLSTVKTFELKTTYPTEPFKLDVLPLKDVLASSGDLVTYNNTVELLGNSEYVSQLIQVASSGLPDATEPLEQLIAGLADCLQDYVDLNFKYIKASYETKLVDVKRSVDTLMENYKLNKR